MNLATILIGISPWVAMALLIVFVVALQGLIHFSQPRKRREFIQCMMLWPQMIALMVFSLVLGIVVTTPAILLLVASGFYHVLRL